MSSLWGWGRKAEGMDGKKTKSHYKGTKGRKENGAPVAVGQEVKEKWVLISETKLIKKEKKEKPLKEGGGGTIKGVHQVVVGNQR